MEIIKNTEFSGTKLGVIAVSLIFLPNTYIHSKVSSFKHLTLLEYQWMIFTCITGLWEACFVVNYTGTGIMAHDLLLKHEHVWTSNYDITYLAPWKFSQIFYAEYGAYADREYMLPHDDLSRVIESSHGVMCGFFCILAVFSLLCEYHNHYLITISIAMGSQFMNSLLYMVDYFHQTRDPSNINYNTNDFPTGSMLEKRPFMYVNIFWMLMPAYYIMRLLLSCSYYKKGNSISLSYQPNEKQPLLPYSS